MRLRLGIGTVQAQERDLEPVDARLEVMAQNALSDTDYQTMINHIVNDTPLEEMEKTSELFKMGSERQYLSIWNCANGCKLVVKNSEEVVVPKGAI